MQIDWIAFTLLTALAIFAIGAFVVYRRRSSSHSSSISKSNGRHDDNDSSNTEKEAASLTVISPFSTRFPNARVPTPLYHAPLGSQEALARNLSNVSLARDLERQQQQQQQQKKGKYNPTGQEREREREDVRWEIA